MTNTTSGPDIRGEEVSYLAGDTKLKGYFAWDASKPGQIGKTNALSLRRPTRHND